MKTILKYSIYILLGSLVLLTSCDKAELDQHIMGAGPDISGLQITPSGDVSYGDEIILTANLQHEKGLYAYQFQVFSGTDMLYEKIQLLTGKSFDVEEKVTLPLPRNAASGDLTILFKAKDYDNHFSEEELTIANVQLPQIDQLFLILDNNKVFPMIRDNNRFLVKDFIPAHASGKIYLNSDKSGLHWGMTNGEVVPLGRNSIPLGKDQEAFFEISFDPYTFDLMVGDAESWSATNESLYILGNISGHWADGNITTELSKMKMQGYQSGDEKYWVWSPPNDGTGSPETDMWGSIVAGSFRFKLAGQDQYLTYAGQGMSLGSDNPGAGFLVSTGGAFTIKVFSKAGEFTKVSLEDSERTLEYTNEGIYINGVPVPEEVNFAGSNVPRVEGSYFTFEGQVSLINGQTIVASGIDLSQAFADPDVFSGGGNSTWKCIGTDGEYLVRLDPFSGSIYVCKLGGYPDVIYLDGWAFGRHASDNRPAWDATSRVCLYRKGDDFRYSGTLFIYPWGGDVSLWAAPYTQEDYGSRLIASKHFTGVTLAGDGFLLPAPADPGRLYEVTVDLKDGFSFDTENLDGGNYTLIPANGKKFSVSFTPK